MRFGDKLKQRNDTKYLKEQRVINFIMLSKHCFIYYGSWMVHIDQIFLKINGYAFFRNKLSFSNLKKK